MTTVDASMFWEPGLHVIPFGHLSILDGGDYNLTVEDRPAKSARGFGLTEEKYRMLETIDITATINSHSFADDELGLLLTLARKDALALVTETWGAEQFRFTVAPRVALEVVRETDEGVLFESSGHQFLMTDIAVRFLTRADGEQVFSDTVQDIKAQLLADEETAGIITAAAETNGLTIDELFFEEALGYLKAITQSGVATIEPYRMDEPL